MSIVTIDQVREHLRYDTEDNDPMLEMYIKSAENAVLNYVTDTFENNVYPDDVKHAVLLMVGMFDREREPSKESSIIDNYLPPAVRALLYPYRTPTAI
ncbi:MULTISPECIES: head-tail connector protein [unclassified Acinetobacter]|uniref:head-tail connector protein n=1 Tax=unclassified Acinetobacter TaxID=196816 RepID=UPI0025C55F82|nr:MULTISPECIES: head-tail connector protein [unclassified Acinetobacter]